MTIKTEYYLAEGESMMPLIVEGDILHIRKSPIKTLRINDVILVYRKGIYIAHRIIYLSAQGVVTKGDNNHAVETAINAKEIIGKVHRIERKGRTFPLENYYRTQSTIYFNEIKKIVTLLKHMHMDFVFLKGLPLHLDLSQKAPSRIYADCDLLVPPTFYQRTIRVLQKLGYQTRNLKKPAFINQKKVEINLEKRVLKHFPPVIFDVHQEPAFLLTRFQTPRELYPDRLIKQLTEQFLTQKRVSKIKGLNLPLLGDIDLCLYLALHFFHHNYQGVFRLEQLSLAIRKQGFNEQKWESLAKQINKYRVTNFVYPVFKLLKFNFKIKIPDSFFVYIRPKSMFVLLINWIYWRRLSFVETTGKIAGQKRFLLAFLLSPEPFSRRILVFFNKDVYWTIFWLIKMRMEVYLKVLQRVKSLLSTP